MSERGIFMYDVVIIGAGIVGTMTARELSKYNLKVCVLEKENDVAMGSTKANSAIIHAGFDATPGSLKAILNVKGSQMMEQITKELGVKYINNGSLVIGFDENDRKTLNELLNRGVKNGVKNLRIIEKEELNIIEPNISENVICALYAPTGSIVCPYELAIACMGNAMDNGVELKLNFEVYDIKKENDYYFVSSQDETVKSKFVINAAGINSDKIAELSGDNSIEIHPRRGEYILLDKNCGNIVYHTIFRTPSEKGKGILVSPTVDNNLLLGPTSEDIENKNDKSVTGNGIENIISQVKENIKTIPLNKTITSFCGLRAVGNTGDFIINSPFKGFVNAAGIESPGLSASPAIAEYICNILKEQGLSLLKKENFNPIRKSMFFFNELTMEEKNEIIKKDKSYGKIICRCEQITEGEILNALRTNPRPTDMDGVKRRTRSQMGRCQGGFCGPQIMDIISKELNIPYIEITKSGGKSYVNLSVTKEV